MLIFAVRLQAKQRLCRSKVNSSITHRLHVKGFAAETREPGSRLQTQAVAEQLAFGSSNPTCSCMSLLPKCGQAPHSESHSFSFGESFGGSEGGSEVHLAWGVSFVSVSLHALQTRRILTYPTFCADMDIFWYGHESLSNRL